MAEMSRRHRAAAHLCHVWHRRVMLVHCLQRLSIEGDHQRSDAKDSTRNARRGAFENSGGQLRTVDRNHEGLLLADNLCFAISEVLSPLLIDCVRDTQHQLPVGNFAEKWRKY